MTSVRITHETARLRLARYRVEAEDGRLRAAMHATQVSADALGVDRVGVWMFSARKDSLACIVEYSASSRTHGTAPDFDLADCHELVTALEGRRVLVVNDVRTHHAMKVFGPAHLVPRGTLASLVAPVLRDGRVVGVVSHEVANVRAWSQRDVDFAGSVADLVTLVFEQSARLELEAALGEHAEQRLESQKMEALGRMAAAIVHDFSNVLGLVGMAAELVMMPPADTGSAVQLIRQSTETGKRLVEQLLAFASDRSPSTAVCDLGAVAERFLPVLQTASGSERTLTFQSTAVDVLVAVDIAEVEQLLLNLVLNARDAIKDTGEIQVVVRHPTPDDNAPPRAVVLVVRDNGVGMNETTRSRVFEPFFTTKPHGTGLGMATVFGIVRRAGGTVRIDSEPGVGTAVTLLLPTFEPS